jgi:hypothetical protein
MSCTQSRALRKDEETSNGRFNGSTCNEEARCEHSYRPAAHDTYADLGARMTSGTPKGPCNFPDMNFKFLGNIVCLTAPVSNASLLSTSSHATQALSTSGVHSLAL